MMKRANKENVVIFKVTFVFAVIIIYHFSIIAMMLIRKMCSHIAQCWVDLGSDTIEYLMIYSYSYSNSFTLSFLILGTGGISAGREERAGEHEARSCEADQNARVCS